jgi:hypothetical protein
MKLSQVFCAESLKDRFVKAYYFNLPIELDRTFPVILFRRTREDAAFVQIICTGLRVSREHVQLVSIRVLSPKSFRLDLFVLFKKND